MYHSAYENTSATNSSSLDAFNRSCLYRLGLWHTVTKTDLQALIKHNLWLSSGREGRPFFLTGGQDLISAALQKMDRNHMVQSLKNVGFFSLWCSLKTLWESEKEFFRLL